MSRVNGVNLKWGAVGLGDVSETNLRNVFDKLGVDFESCAHITANESLAKVLRSAGVRAISAVELTDVIVWDSMPQRQRIPITDYPVLDHDPDAPEGTDPIAVALSAWRRRLTGNRIGFNLHVDNVLRTYLREDAADEHAANLIRRSVREFRATIEFLSASNLGPDSFVADESLVRVALDAWRHAESSIPDLAKVRLDLWGHHGKIADPKDPSSRDLRRRLDETLGHVFGCDGGELQILLHGFFFFTPQQWALFKLLKSHPSVNMCFVVHDDGRDRAFETWRHYFIERWTMPSVRYLDVPRSGVRSSTLRSSLEGRRVEAAPVANNTRIVRFANTTEFVRDWKLQEDREKSGDRKPLLFAPLPDDVERVIDRMSSDRSGTSINLANLPVGQFLLAAHDCVEYSSRTNLERTLNGDRLVDMAASTFLDSPAEGVKPSRFVPAIRRALPFFTNLHHIDEWIERAKALERLVLAEVAQLGARDDGHSDIERMNAMANNELRLVPWCDLTLEEVRMVRFAVEAAKAVVDEIASEGLRRTDNYVAWIRKRLERAMANLDPEGRDEIERKLHGVGVGMSGEIDPEGIRDVVGMILGREIETGPGDGDRSNKRVKDVRSVDALGFRKSKVDVHVANLAETVFPAKAFPYGWPFSERALKEGDGRNVSTEILATRAATAPLGDLYLMRVALDGVPADSTLTLSWIGEARGEHHNPSTLLNLITEPKVPSAKVRERAGGLALSPANHGAPIGGLRTLPETRPFDLAVAEGQLAASVVEIPRIAKGSALICPRRFVIQWALGPTASFQSPHQHSMLFGNVLGALSRRRRFMVPGSAARDVRVRLVTDLWRHLTPGQRASSLSKRRVHEIESGGASANWEWIFTIGGKRDGESPTDQAYRVSLGRIDVNPTDLLGGSSDSVIPDSGDTVTAKECNMCPVSPRCAARVLRDD